MKFLTFLTVVFMACISSDAQADTIQKMEGTFKDTITIVALDKVTARTSDVTFKVGEIIKIGTLKIKVLRAWVSNPSEQPEAKVFFEISEKRENKKETLVFKGWMFASNPAVSALEHPVYDIWVKEVTGKIFDGEVPQSDALDEETSERIDDLIDRLMDQSANTDSTEEVEVIEDGNDGDLEKGTAGASVGGTSEPSEDW